jgi:hypothetical protein
MPFADQPMGMETFGFKYFSAENPVMHVWRFPVAADFRRESPGYADVMQERRVFYKPEIRLDAQTFGYPQRFSGNHSAVLEYDIKRFAICREIFIEK